MKVLVTGGAGYIGSHAVSVFRRAGHEVVVFDNLSHGHRAAVAPGALVVGDLADRESVERTLRESSIDAVVHFAAWTYVGESVEDPGRYYRNNVVNTLNLLDAMRAAGVGKFVFSSTAATFGTPEADPIDESSPQRPINPYGRSKLMVEWMLADYAAAYGLAYAALRYFNAAGASGSGDLGEDHDPETHLIPIVLQVALGRRPHVSVFGTDYPTPDGTCVRDYVHVDDLAVAHLSALERLRPGKGNSYNLGNGRGFSVREVIRACEAVSGRPIPVVEAPRRAGDPPRLVASSAKAEKELDWRPRYPDLHAIVGSAWNWIRRHPGGYASE